MYRYGLILAALACLAALPGASVAQALHAAPAGSETAHASGPLAHTAATVEESTKHSGCVTLFVRNVWEGETEWLELKAQMAGCARGHLHLHTYVNYEEIFGGVSFYHDGETNECENSTECSVIWSGRIYLTEIIGTYGAYAHGWNTTTGGSNYVILEYVH